MKKTIKMKQNQRRRQQRAMQDKVVYGLFARAFASREKQEKSNCKLKVDSSQCVLGENAENRDIGRVKIGQGVLA